MPPLRVHGEPDSGVRQLVGGLRGLPVAMTTYEADKLTAYEWKYLVMYAPKTGPFRITEKDKTYEVVVKEIDATTQQEQQRRGGR